MVFGGPAMALAVGVLWGLWLRTGVKSGCGMSLEVGTCRWWSRETEREEVDGGRE